MNKWRTVQTQLTYNHFLDDGNYYYIAFINDMTIRVSKKALNEIKKKITECFTLRYNEDEQLIKLIDNLGNEAILEAEID